MRFKRTLIGAASLFLMTCMQACTGIVPAVKQSLPDLTLIQACPEPAPPADHTNGGLVQSILDYQTVLDHCNDDKAALRAWANSLAR